MKKKDEIVEEVEAVDEAPVSKTKAQFKALIEAYKASNPVKYALKKEELAKKLAAL